MVNVMSGNEPFVDLVQVRADDAFGTGLLVGRGLVLTALHCACDPKGQWRVRNNLGVYLLRDLQQGIENHLDAHIVWPRTEILGKHPPDVAVLQIDGDCRPVPSGEHKFGDLPRTPTVGSARGFPASSKGSFLPGGRIEYDQPGRVTYTSATRRALTIDATGPYHLDGLQRWAGLSGGPLFANGLIVGVMREVSEGWRGEAIEAEPLAPLLLNEADASLRTLLNVTLPLANRAIPYRPPWRKPTPSLASRPSQHLAALCTLQRPSPSTAVQEIWPRSTMPSPHETVAYYCSVVGPALASRGWRYDGPSTARSLPTLQYCDMPSLFGSQLPAPARQWWQIWYGKW